MPKDFKTNQIQNLFNDEYFKTANVSQFALALVQALRHVEQSTKMYHIESFFKLRFLFCFSSFRQQQANLSYYLSDQMSNSSNRTTIEKNNDILLKQLLKNITAPQQLNGIDYMNLLLIKLNRDI